MIRQRIGRITAWLGLAALLAGCGGAHVSQASAAAISTAIATGAAVARRAEGDCFTWCARGTQCNPATGLCEPLPCSGGCKEGEVCDSEGPIPKCVPQDVWEQMMIERGLTLPGQQGGTQFYQTGVNDPASPVKQPPPPQ
jgi:hypothetical protein